jgi:hypothetical protein
VTDVVERMAEDSLTAAGTAPPVVLEVNPDGFNAGLSRDGRVRQPLPLLGPCDVWWIHDPTVEFVLR